MATTKTTINTEMRRCAGSARFGIEPHEAPVADFPAQPSRKDGLGTICAAHWKAYVKGLTADRKVRAVALVTDAGTTIALSEASATTVDRVVARGRRAARPASPDPKVAAAEALIAQVDALPGPEVVKRTGDPEVQAALETVAAARGTTRETPLGEGIGGGTGEADAA